MSELFVWIKDIILIILSLSFFEVLIPNSKTDKYIKFIFSLIILAIIVDPIIILINKCNI